MSEIINNQEDQPVILCVDDERAITTSLKRALRGLGKVLTADSGLEALEILESTPVDLILTDMRMPGMNGAELLKEVIDRGLQPARILLTGFSDLESLASAVNDGRINRYLRKPWDNNELVHAVEQELNVRRLERENIELAVQVQKQNQQLTELNANLELKVEERTEQLRLTNEKLEASILGLKEAQRATSRIFYNLLSLNRSTGGKQAILIGKLCGLIAANEGASKEQIGQIRLAGILSDLGLLCMDSELRNKPWYEMSEEERELYISHPQYAVAAMAPATHLAVSAQAIKHQFEKYNGSGKPEGLKGDLIPLGARILAVARDYVRVMNGTMQKGRLSSYSAFKELEKGSQHTYCPKVLNSLFAAIPLLSEEFVNSDERVVSTSALRPGMVLSRDVFNRRQILLLPKNFKLTLASIEKLEQVEEAEDMLLEIYIAK